MTIFDLISLLGGLAMFLYGMRLMGDSLKASSSGPLKSAMEKLTNTPVKAFLLGALLTAIIQSSTATIVITSGLVGAGIISLHQSLGIVVGANVGTTVTGQIIRLLDLNGASGGASLLNFFKPSTLAPLALIIGIVLIMFCSFKNSNTLGSIAVGFGILFVGLINMTDAVGVLSESGVLENVLVRFSTNPILGYIAGAVVAFILQSSSASVGILQAFATSGQLTFQAIYAVLTGIYLGDCVTTAIVCYIGAKPDAKRVATVNVLFNIAKMVMVLVAVTILHGMGFLSNIWNAPITSGGIANTNTVFNLVCAVVLLPFLGAFERMSKKINKDEPVKVGKYSEQLASLNPLFFNTPGIAFDNSYQVLVTMLKAANENLNKAIGMIFQYDAEVSAEIEREEDEIDTMADRVSGYLVQVSAHIREQAHVGTMDYYLKLVNEFERLGDHAVNLAETATTLAESGNELSGTAKHEISVLAELIQKILGLAQDAFFFGDMISARQIEPLEEVVDSLVAKIRDNHLERLLEQKCSVITGTELMNLLSDMERISDVCSNVGIATIVRERPELANQTHGYVATLHAGDSEEFNRTFTNAYNEYFNKLNVTE